MSELTENPFIILLRNGDAQPVMHEGMYLCDKIEALLRKLNDGVNEGVAEDEKWNDRLIEAICHAEKAHEHARQAYVQLLGVYCRLTAGGSPAIDPKG